MAEWEGSNAQSTEHDVEREADDTDTEQLPAGWERVHHDDGQVYYESK